MKRIALVLIALLLLVPAARAENRLLRMPQGEYLINLLADGETLYLVSDTRLWAWREGDDAPAELTCDLRLPADGQEDEGTLSLYEFTLFADGAGLHGVRLLRDDSFQPRALQLCDLALGEDGVAKPADARTLDLPGGLLVESLYPEQACARDGVLYLLLQEERGYSLAIIDPEDPRSGRVEALDSWDYRLLTLPDGVLLASRNYMNGEDVLTLFRVEANGSMEALCALSAGISALAADVRTGAVYAVLEGRVRPVDLSTGELGEAIAALPVLPYRGAVLGDGRFFAAEIGGSVAVLETGGRLAEDSVLTIQGSYAGEWLEKALVEYSVAHPEITPVFGNDSWNALNDIMSQSPDTDIYVLDMQNGADFDALLDRGYMLPLDSGEALAALEARIYPNLLRRLTRDGRLVALPLNVWGSGMGMSGQLLEKLGFSIDEVPDDWPGFLDFMEDQLKPCLDRLGGNDAFTYDEMNAADFGYFLKRRALEDFVQCSYAAGVVPDYGDPRLLEVLERLDGMDFTDYGLPEKREEDESFGYGWSSENAYLIQFEAGYAFGQQGMSDCTPTPLGFGEDLPGVLPLSISAAFVNPYSAHAEQAVAFLEAISAQMPDELLYALCPDLNEPVRAPDFEQMSAMYEAWINSLQVDVAPQDRQAQEEELKFVEREYEAYLERDSWAVSEERLAWYRANGDRIVAAVPSWFTKDTSGEAWQLLEQYDKHQLTAREFLDAVSRKARMMAMEEG